MLRRRRSSINIRSLWWHICFILYVIEKVNNSVMFVCRLFVAVKVVIRVIFVLLNNVYCIPTYCVWMLMLLPLRKLYPPLYWKMEGLFFHWLLAMVTMWSWTAGYDRKYLTDWCFINFNHTCRIILAVWRWRFVIWYKDHIFAWFVVNLLVVLFILWGDEGRPIFWKIKVKILLINDSLWMIFDVLFSNC